MSKKQRDQVIALALGASMALLPDIFQLFDLGEAEAPLFRIAAGLISLGLAIVSPFKKDAPR